MLIIKPLLFHKRQNELPQLQKGQIYHTLYLYWISYWKLIGSLMKNLLRMNNLIMDSDALNMEDSWTPVITRRLWLDVTVVEWRQGADELSQWRLSDVGQQPDSCCVSPSQPHIAKPSQNQQNCTAITQLRPTTKSMPLYEAQTQGQESSNENSVVRYADIP